MYIDKKFTGWCRFYFPADLEIPEFESEKEVEEFINDYFIECENLYDTEEYMSVVNNDGNRTIEVYTDDNEIVWKNGN